MILVIHPSRFTDAHRGETKPYLRTCLVQVSATGRTAFETAGTNMGKIAVQSDLIVTTVSVNTVPAFCLILSSLMNTILLDTRSCGNFAERL